MTGYSRISVPPTEYRDEAGVVIPYGSRWTAGSPPEDSYSRVSNPQRLAPAVPLTATLTFGFTSPPANGWLPWPKRC